MIKKNNTVSPTTVEKYFEINYRLHLKLINSVSWTDKNYNALHLVLRVVEDIKNKEDVPDEDIAKATQLSTRVPWIREIHKSKICFLEQSGKRRILVKTYFGPHTEKGLLLVKNNEIEMVLLALYNEPGNHCTGRDSFYSTVCNYYAGISRRKVEDFLKNNETYQRHRPVIQRKNVTPIVTHDASDHWEMDVVVMDKWAHSNKGYGYILTIIDHYSKYAYAIPLKHHDSKSIYSSLKKIFEDIKSEQGKIPKKIHTDRGAEFSDPIMKKLYSDYGINHIMGYAYTPQSQGLVEGFNKILKRRLWSFTEDNPNKWVEILDHVIDGYNNTRNSSTGFTPAEVYFLHWHPEEDKNKWAYMRQKIRDANAKKVNRAINKNTHQVDIVNIGDWVRLSKFQWNPTMSGESGVEHRRDDMKKGFVKKYMANWSKQLYQVYKIIHPSQWKHIPGKYWYLLKDVAGNELPHKYVREEILKVDIKKLKDREGRSIKPVQLSENQVKRLKQREEYYLSQKRENQIPVSTTKIDPEKKEEQIIQKKSSSNNNNSLIGTVILMRKEGEWKKRGTVVKKAKQGWVVENESGWLKNTETKFSTLKLAKKAENSKSVGGWRIEGKTYG